MTRARKVSLLLLPAAKLAAREYCVLPTTASVTATSQRPYSTGSNALGERGRRLRVAPQPNLRGGQIDALRWGRPSSLLKKKELTGAQCHT